jgi:hypothetical protein
VDGVAILGLVLLLAELEFRKIEILVAPQFSLAVGLDEADDAPGQNSASTPAGT